MADNVTLNSGTGGATVAAASLTISGDTAIVQMVGVGLLSGSEGSWTHTQIVGGAGAVTAGVPRVTLASDDPGVAKLTTIDADTSALAACASGSELQVDIVSAALPTGASTLAEQQSQTTHLATIAGDTTSLDAKVTACNTGAVVIASGAVTVSATNLDIRDLTSASDSVAAVCTNAGTFAVQAAQSTASSLKTETWGGAKGATTALVVTATAAGTDHNAIDVCLRDSTGLDLDFRAENENWNAADHGILVFGRDIASTPNKYRAIALNAEGDLQCDLSDINGNEPNVGSGAAGTGTLRIIMATDSPDVTALQVIDDWDESDRAKVNLVVGQAGITAGAGAVAANTPRVTHASDDPAVTALQLIDNAISGAGFNITQFGGAAVPIGAGTEAAAVRVTIATDSTGVLSVDDNGGALTVDGTVTVGSITNALPAGSNAIGKLSANSGVDIGDVDVTSISAGTNTIGGVISQPSASVAYDGTTSCTVKRFMVVTSTDGADLIAAVADKKFRILSFAIFATATTATAFWLEDADGTDVFGDSTGITLDIDGGSGPAGLVLQHNPYGWWQTAATNKDLHIKLTAAQKVVVTGTYIEVA